MKTIAEVIAEHGFGNEDWNCWCGWRPDDSDTEWHVQHAAHVAHAIREARTVQTVEELLALPHGTYIHAAGGVFPNDEVPKAEWEAVLEDCAPLIALPARVLWTPGDEP